MDNITVELNGIKYLLMEVPITNRKRYDQLVEYGKSHSFITQGATVIRGGFWSSDITIVKVLVPEKEIEAFNNHEFN